MEHLILANASRGEPIYTFSQFGAFRGRWRWCDGFDSGDASSSGISGRAGWWVVQVLARMVSSAASDLVAYEASVLLHVAGAFDR